MSSSRPGSRPRTFSISLLIHVLLAPRWLTTACFATRTLNLVLNVIEDNCVYLFLWDSWVGDKNMRTALKALAGGAIIGTAFQAGISLPLFVGLFRSVRAGLQHITASGPSLVDAMVDWLEAAYGGPIDS